MRHRNLMALMLSGAFSMASGTTTLADDVSAIAQSDYNSAPSAFAMGVVTMFGYVAYRTLHRRLRFHHRGRHAYYGQHHSTSRH